MTSAPPVQDARPEPPAPGRPSPRVGAAARVLVLARVALVPTITCYAVSVVLAAVVVALASGTTPGGEPGLDQAVAVGVPLWLAAHLVPLRLSGAPFGALPLAPALGVAALVAVVARGAFRRLSGGTGGAANGPGTNPVGSVVATATAAHAVIGVFAAAMLAPETVVDASPGQAGVVAGLLAGLAALVGVAGPSGLTAEVRRRTPAWARRGIVAGAFAASGLLTTGALLVLAALLAHAGPTAEMIARIAPQAGSGVGLTLLGALYLPNAVIGATSWVLGPGVSIGLASAAPTAAVAAPLPPLPLLAVMPSGAPPSWAGLVFAVPLAIGTAVGWRLAPSTADRTARLRALAAVATAATTAAVLLGLAAALAGGRLGAGPFDPVSVPALLVVVATVAWVLVPAATVALLAVPAPRPSRATTRRGRPAATATPAPPDDARSDDAGSDDAPADDPAPGDAGSDGAGAGGAGEGGVTPVTTGSATGGDPDEGRPD